MGTLSLKVETATASKLGATSKKEGAKRIQILIPSHQQHHLSL